MGRTTKKETRRRLRDAVVYEAIEKGFGGMSVSSVVKRARVSAGTVYVHFKTKDDMLQQVFLEIKSEFHAVMLRASETHDSTAMVRRMWFDMFDFVSEHPQDFLFLEYGNSAQFLTPEQKIEVGRMYGEIGAMIQGGIDDGTLAPLEVSIVSLLLVAPAMQLARSAVLTDKAIPPEVVELTFERVWRSIAADPAQNNNPLHDQSVL